jgi:ADA HAT complex component 1
MAKYRQPPVKVKIDTDTLRAILETEINQAILFKHNELRLVDQELAKCQIALEQIRRCDLIPTPVTQIPILAFSKHTGPTLVAPPGYSVLNGAAPRGVTDGPYTQHYAQWLLRNHFPHRGLNSPLPLGRDGRVTRGSAVEVYTPMGAPQVPTKRRRGTINQAVLRRWKDGQLVKLFCTNCNPERSNFGNMQGFLLAQTQY